jgi:hypothetical protein
LLHPHALPGFFHARHKEFGSLVIRGYTSLQQCHQKTKPNQTPTGLRKMKEEGKKRKEKRKEEEKERRKEGGREERERENEKKRK